MNKENLTNTFCSFCGKAQDKVKTLVAGPHGLYICDECIDICQSILKDDKKTDANGEINLFSASAFRFPSSYSKD